MNINSYKYSNLNSIGDSLKQPLFKLVRYAVIDSVHEKKIFIRITKIVLMTLVCVIPVSFAWLLGKSITYFSRTKIDSNHLSLSPPKIEIPEENEQDKLIDIAIILQRFDACDSIVDKEVKRARLARLCRLVKTEDDSIYGDNILKRQMFCKELSILLRRIIIELQSGSLSEDEEKIILNQLAEASFVCYPTWLEVTSKLYAEHCCKSNPIQIKVLRFVQQYKENLILEFCQTEMEAQWHALNFVRNILGQELGLNTTSNENDPYAAKNDPIFGKMLTKWMFLQKYEDANRLVSSIRTMINLEKYDQNYHTFFVNALKKKKIEDTDSYIPDHFYDENYAMTEVGVNFLLKEIGILK